MHEFSIALINKVTFKSKVFKKMKLTQKDFSIKTISTAFLPNSRQFPQIQMSFIISSVVKTCDN